MYHVSYDSFHYWTDDGDFAGAIPIGQCEPYPRDLAVISRYRTLFPSRGRTYIDIGAHIGTTLAPYSRLFAQRIGFEANPDAFTLLRKNMTENKIECQLEPVALYDHACRGTIRQHGSNSGCYYFTEDPDGPVECRTLDSYAFESVDFLKIDVEGAELAVLTGAKETLLRCKPLVQLECNGLSDRLYGVSRADILSFLKDLGYVLYAEAGANLFFYVPRLEPYQIFCYWGASPMSETRQRSLDLLRERTGCAIILLTHKTFPQVALPEFPIHPAFPFLSDVHQSDYARIYLMHHYGGGYSDIKRPLVSWRGAFDDLLASDAWVNGYPEPGPGGIAYLPVLDKWESLVGNGAYICLPRTPLTTEWYTAAHALLDERLPILRVNPARSPRDMAEYGTGYPLEWNELLGRIFHRVCATCLPHILRTLSPPSFASYL